MKIFAYTDPVGSNLKSQEEEYEDIFDEISELLGIDDIDYRINISPDKLKNVKFDAYIFDFGGMNVSNNGNFCDFTNSLLDAIDEHPNSLFIVWSLYTQIFYQDMIYKMYPEFKEFPNVAMYSNDIDKGKIQKWFGKEENHKVFGIKHDDTAWWNNPMLYTFDNIK